MQNAPPEHASYYLLHDVCVEVGWDDPDVAEAVQAVLDYFGFSRLASAAPSLPRVRLSFLREAKACALPDDACLLTLHNGVEVWRGDPYVYLRERASLMQLDPAAGTGRGTICAPLWRRPGVLRLELVNLIIHSVLIPLRCCGLYPLHAAAGARDGAGLLLVAGSDSGKSTLSMGLVRQGWQYLSDDSVLLRPLESGVEVWPLRRDFGLDEEAVHSFPEIAAHRRPFVTDELKQRIDMGTLYPEQAAEACIPRVLVFPEIVARPESRLLPLRQTDAVLGLMRQSVLLGLGSQTASAQLEVLGRLADQTKSYRLLAGQDLKQDPAVVAQLFAPLMATPATTYVA